MVATPQFGDRKYSSAELIPPIEHYPRHPTSTPFEDALRSTNYFSQQHSRVLFFQPYGYDLRDAFGDSTAVRRARASSTWFSIARARRNIPEEITHVRCILAVAALYLQRSTLNARVTVVGAGTDSASNTKTIDASDPNSAVLDIASLSFNERARRSVAFPFTSGYAPLLHEVAVGFSNIDSTSPGRVRITLDVYATQDSDGTPVSVQPLFAMGLGEMVY